MRFLADGPDIPNELLLARDQGRTVFFCGAGVSRAKANLPDFFELAKKVTQNLGVSKDNPANKIIDEAKEIGDRIEVDGLISADRMFGLLERDFLVSDIQEAVSKALKVSTTSDTSVHQTLIRLATTQEGIVRLVTTNFDRLFDICKPELTSFVSPKLPDPLRTIDFDGIVYLHGKINHDGKGPEGEGFILSSAEFGRAYLSEGWATSFFKETLNRYNVVFVGYSADDPPIQYLLEALNRADNQIGDVYAFQSGDTNYANAKWQHKGVRAIAYDSADDHQALWDTLNAWAIRADNPDDWIANVIEKARSGPGNLSPHERGQIAHVVSTLEGMSKFSAGDTPPPATWLNVFDSNQRYAKPGYQGSILNKGQYIDPFDLYSLDSDLIPNKIDPEDYYAKREVPKGAWDAFTLNSLDRKALRDENISSLKGVLSKQSLYLPSRLSILGAWISKIAKQPEALTWAIEQGFIHLSIQKQISWQFERSEDKTFLAIQQAWQHLFEYWSEDHSEINFDWYDFDLEIDRSGWSEILLRRFAKLAKPYIKVDKNYYYDQFQTGDQRGQLKNLISLDVEYPNIPKNYNIPNEWLYRVIIVLRRNLETALDLESAIGGFGLSMNSPITPDDHPDRDSYSRSHGLSGWVLFFISQFKKLMAVDLNSAKLEFNKWPIDDSTIFARLRIWAMGQTDLIPAEQIATIMAQLSDQAFWDSYHKRDLLLTISKRWNELEVNVRNKLEQRILKGPNRWEGEEEKEFNERKAQASLNWLNWLNEQKCPLQLNLNEITRELRKVVPKWKPEYALKADESMEGLSGWVSTEQDCSALLDEPLNSILAKVKKLTGRQDNMLVSYDPFSGFSQEHPIRAFAALRLEAKNGEFPQWAWRAFLNPKQRMDDNNKFIAFIGEQLSQYPKSELNCIIRPVTDWLDEFAKVLATEYPDIFSRLVSKLIDVLSLNSDESSSAIVRGNKEVDWIMESINSPTGKLAQAVFDDSQTNDLKKGESLPESWLKYVEALIRLPEDHRRYALAIFARNLSWFFFFAPKWTDENILSILDAESREDKQALWAGFLWGGKAEGYELFKILKPHLLKIAKSEKIVKAGHTEVLVGMLLSAWALVDEENHERWISNDELRDVLLNSKDEVRTRILWQAEKWLDEDPKNWSSLVVELLSDVWPRQISAKSGIVSARLCEIAFSDKTLFTKLTELVLPLVTKIEQDHLMLPNLRRDKNNIVDLYPHDTLALLYAVLPDNVALWPYGIDSTFERISDADSNLNSDERLIELKRKWDTR